MAYYRDYRGFEVHFEEEENGGREIRWTVKGYGREHAKGSANSRQEAFFAACASIDGIQGNSFRFPVNLLGYPENSEGDVATRDGEVLGRWLSSGDESLEFVDFIPEGTDEVLFREHHVGILCSKIRDWHERADKS